jgi:hypothetical protein
MLLYNTIALLALGCSDRVASPSQVKFIETPLPQSVSGYHEHESGFPHTLYQARFTIPVVDLDGLRWPCTLGAAQTGPPHFATVGTNTRSWYRPEDAVQHRGCAFPNQGGILSGSVLADISDPALAQVFLVVAIE